MQVSAAAGRRQYIKLIDKVTFILTILYLISGPLSFRSQLNGSPVDPIERLATDICYSFSCGV
jgi:hypothetical protein